MILVLMHLIIKDFNKRGNVLKYFFESIVGQMTGWSSASFDKF